MVRSISFRPRSRRCVLHFFAETVQRGMTNRGLADALGRAGVDLGSVGGAAGEKFLGAIESLVRPPSRPERYGPT